MKFSEEVPSTYNNITRYGEGYVQIKDKVVNTSVVIGVEALLADWRPKDFSELSVDDCGLLIQSKPDVIILGTGEKQYFPDHDILKFFVQQQIGLEVMDTAAACRTFNILLSEDRNVVAGLFMI